MTGTATTVVFLHGLGEGPEVWDHQLAHLPSDLRGLSLHMPGFDPAAPPLTPFTLAASAEALATELDRRQIRRAHLCGLSLGAMLALQFAMRRPDRITSLTLAAPQAKPPRALMAVQSGILRLIPARFLPAGSPPKPLLLEVLADAARTDLTPDLASIHAPTLVLCGQKDRANLPAARRIAHAISGARLHVLEGAGHLSHLEAPEAFSRELHAFLTDAP
ncbi:MAG: alpha/beta fold hydrolase [Dermabacter sp.]|nr:alpha/beta fold hydrolase [Dermabacter sp.]